MAIPRWSALLAAAATAILLSAAAPEPDAGLIVFRSSGPTAPRNHPVGQRLPDGARLALRPGDTLILVKGEFARRFRGPGFFVARMADPPGSGSTAPATYHRRPVGAPHVPSERDPDLARFTICPQDPRCPR